MHALTQLIFNGGYFYFPMDFQFSVELAVAGDTSSEVTGPILVTSSVHVDKNQVDSPQSLTSSLVDDFIIGSHNVR